LKIRDLRVLDANMFIFDNDSKDLFEFNIINYYDQLNKSRVVINSNKSIVVSMPDYYDFVPKR